MVFLKIHKRTQILSGLRKNTPSYKFINTKQEEEFIFSGKNKFILR